MHAFRVTSRAVHRALAIGALIASAAVRLEAQPLAPAPFGTGEIHSPRLQGAVVVERKEDDAPVRTVLFATGGSVLYGFLGTVGGMLVDNHLCQRRAEPDDDSFLGPCPFFPMEDWTHAGFGAGAVFGATFVVARRAVKRGCPAQGAWLRAAGGALVGAAPGLLVIANRPDRFTRSTSPFLVSLPILSAVGATVATRTCGRGG